MGLIGPPTERITCRGLNLEVKENPLRWLRFKSHTSRFGLSAPARHGFYSRDANSALRASDLLNQGLIMVTLYPAEGGSLSFHRPQSVESYFLSSRPASIWAIFCHSKKIFPSFALFSALQNYLSSLASPTGSSALWIYVDQTGFSARFLTYHEPKIYCLWDE